MKTNNIGIYDIHCHLLPGIDDGCKTVDESIEVLRQSAEQRVHAIIATPHYYPKESVDSFLKRRRNAANMLIRGLAETNVQHPAVYFGAEVAYHSGLIYEEKLDDLCLASSNFLLLELPFSKWTPSVLRDVKSMRNSRGIIPIIAHLERFLKMQDKRTIEDLFDSDVLIQMNAEYILNPKTKRQAKILLKKDRIHFLGSDCHNLSSRPPNLGLAVEQLFDWGMGPIARDICLNCKVTILKE